MPTANIIWKSPVALTELLSSPKLSMLPKRECVLSLRIEGDTGDEEILLVFENVLAFKCTYMAACTAEMFNLAYGKVVDIGTSSWLADIVVSYKNTHKAPVLMRHMMICFDDGPCYEFVCDGFKEEKKW